MLVLFIFLQLLRCQYVQIEKVDCQIASLFQTWIILRFFENPEKSHPYFLDSSFHFKQEFFVSLLAEPQLKMTKILSPEN